MLKIRTICIGLCITEEKVMENPHIDLSVNEQTINEIHDPKEHIKEEQETEKTDEIKENKPDEIKQDVIQQTKPKYSFVQKVIFIIFFLVCIIVLSFVVVTQITKMREKALLVDLLKQETKYQKDSMGEAIFIKNFFEIKFREKKLVDLSFCKRGQENFLVVIKDESEYFVYIFYPDQQEMIIIHSRNYHNYDVTVHNMYGVREEGYLIFRIFQANSKEIFDYIAHKVLTVQNFFLQKTEVFFLKAKNQEGKDIQCLERRLKGQPEIKAFCFFRFFYFLNIFLEKSLPENLQNLKANHLFLFSKNGLSLVSKQEIEINEQSLLKFEKYEDNNIFFFIETRSNDVKFFVYFFKGEIIIMQLTENQVIFPPNSKITEDDQQKIQELFQKVKEKKELLEIKQKEKIETFFREKKGLFDAAIKKCQNPESQAKIMSISDFLEIFLTKEKIE